MDRGWAGKGEAAAEALQSNRITKNRRAFTVVYRSRSRPAPMNGPRTRADASGSAETEPGRSPLGLHVCGASFLNQTQRYHVRRHEPNARNESGHDVGVDLVAGCRCQLP